MMDNYKELGLVIAAFTAFIIFYKRFLRREGDKPYKPAIIIISVMMLAGIYNTNREFLEKHRTEIISIAVCLLAVTVFMELYESGGEETPLKQIFRIDPTGNVTQH